MSNATPEQQAEAREIGWRPVVEFRGNADNWVDADVYLQRGREVLPLVKANNKRLETQVSTLTAEITRLTAAVAEQQSSMTEFAKFNQEQLAEKLAEQKRNLTRELREARKDDDDTRIEDLEERLEENAEARATLKAAPPPKEAPANAPPAVQETPEYIAWKANNAWFGGTSKADIAKTAAAHAFAAQVAAQGKRGQAFFDAVDAEMAEVYPPTQRREKAEEGRPSGGGGNTGSSDSSFNALPSDAKAKAKEQVSRFVGPNKMFKDEKAWFAYFAKQYNTEAA